MDNEQFEAIITEIRQNTEAVGRLDGTLQRFLPLLVVLVVFAFYGLLRRGLRKAVVRGVR